MTRRAVVVQFAAFVVLLGLPDGALGVLWPSMRHTFHRPVGDLGYVAVASTVLYLLGGLLFAWLVARVRVPTLTAWSCLSAAVATAAWASAGTWAVVLVAVAAFGLGRGILDAAVNAAASGQLRRLGWLHAGWSLGGAAGPAVVAALAAHGSWRAAVAVLAVLAAAVGVVALRDRRGADAAGPAGDATRPPPGAAAPGDVRAPLLPLAVVLATFAAYTAAEIGPTVWGYVYLTDHRRLGTAAAAAAVAAFWIALTTGRVALGAAGHRLDPAPALMACCLLFAAALALVAWAPTAVAVAALAFAGLACAAMFPLLVNATPAIVGAAAGDRVVGYAIAAAAGGGPLAVFVEGQLADSLGVGVLGGALFAVAALLVVVAAVFVRTLTAATRVAA